MSTRDFLVEIGTEELPPKSLFTLAESFANGVQSGLDNANVQRGEIRWYATPRRLAVCVLGLAEKQPDQEIRRQGPAVAQAIDSSGNPTKGALGFAASCGVEFDQLEQADGPKGKVLQHVGIRKGSATADLLPHIVAKALDELPIARRMRWGSSNQMFVRPVHWVVMLFGTEVVPCTILGVESGRATRGHRFHAPQEFALATPTSYVSMLASNGCVIADAAERKEKIRVDVHQVAQSLGGTAVVDETLLDEVAALVEWPAAIAGRFDATYLKLPEEVPIATMQDHQRYFPVRDADGRLMNAFITVANIQSRDPGKVRDGNERVVRPRLADAAFFWDLDRRQRLDSRRDALRSVTFQNKLGSVFDKSERVARLATRISSSVGADETQVRRASELSKCDLLSAMVGEFPELQGLMGKYYAQHDGEAAAVCDAIEQHYWPRFAGDRLPTENVAVAVSMADKLDTLAGIFAIGQKPTGTRDPFGLRRASLGILRIMLERSIDLDLRDLIEVAVGLQPVRAEKAASEIWEYMLERLRGSYLEGQSGVSTEMFDAVIAANARSVRDIDERLTALTSFLKLPAASSLAAANKRIANLLRKATSELSEAVDAKGLIEPAEQALFQHVLAVERAVNPMITRREYSAVLTELAELRTDVDAFFDTVMVMTDDARLRTNRLGLLLRLRNLFLQIVDLSRLPG
jgi:glycyl-tRNA synthetase beta chain